MTATVVVGQFLGHGAAFAHGVPGIGQWVRRACGQLHPGLFAVEAGVAQGAAGVGVGVNETHVVDRRADVVADVGVERELRPPPQGDDHLVGVGDAAEAPAVGQFVGAMTGIGHRSPPADFEFFHRIGVAEDPQIGDRPAPLELAKHRADVGIIDRRQRVVGAHWRGDHTDRRLCAEERRLADLVVVAIGVGVTLAWVDFHAQIGCPRGDPTGRQEEVPAVVEAGAVKRAAGGQRTHAVDGLERRSGQSQVVARAVESHFDVGRAGAGDLATVDAHVGGLIDDKRRAVGEVLDALCHLHAVGHEIAQDGGGVERQGVDAVVATEEEERVVGHVDTAVDGGLTGGDGVGAGAGGIVDFALDVTVLGVLGIKLRPKQSVAVEERLTDEPIGGGLIEQR